jgi:hypothetical protein
VSGASPRPPARTVDPVVWQRIGTLTRGAFGRVRDIYTRVAFGAISGALIGIVVAFITAPSMPGLVLGTVLAAGCVLVGAARLIRRELRQAFELVLDLQRAGRRLWRDGSGATAPESRGSARQWIDSHPAEPVPIAMLLVVGRLEEADEAIAALGDVPKDAAFDVELLSQTRRLYGGDAPDLTVVRELWRTLPQPRRDVARGELAALEAQAATASHKNPVPVLAAARLEVSGVHWSVRTPVFVTRWVIVAIVPVGLAWLLRPALPFW